MFYPKDTHNERFWVLMFRKERRSKAQSKKMLALALIALLSKKEINEIKITELTKKADLSRKTFYKNFDVKEDVLEYFEKMIYIEMFTKINQSDIGTIYDVGVVIFSHILDYKQEFRILYDKNLLYSSTVIDKLAKEQPSLFIKFDQIIKPGKNDFEDAFVFGGFLFILVEWIRTDFVQSPIFLARLLEEQLTK